LAERPCGFEPRPRHRVAKLTVCHWGTIGADRIPTCSGDLVRANCAEVPSGVREPVAARVPAAPDALVHVPCAPESGRGNVADLEHLHYPVEAVATAQEQHPGIHFDPARAEGGVWLWCSSVDELQVGTTSVMVTENLIRTRWNSRLCQREMSSEQRLRSRRRLATARRCDLNPALTSHRSALGPSPTRG
jgi:hypothetical protein